MEIIITGAANGIGRAIVKACCDKEYSVHACDIDGEGLERLKEECPDIEIYQVDVSNYSGVKEFFNKLDLEHDSKSLALINNAGIYLAKDLMAYAETEIDRVVDVNIKGAVYFSKFFAGLVTINEAAGRIVNITSVSGQEGSSDAVYGMTKAALLGLTKSCAMNYAPAIRVNAVAPTMVETKMMERIPAWRKEEYHDHHLIRDPVTPEAVAETVLFLLSDGAGHYTGATFDLNNGGYLR